MPSPVRLAVLLLLIGTTTAPAAAAPLCKDLKGLFTPCPRQASGTIAASPVDGAVAAAKEEHRQKAVKQRRAEGAPETRGKVAIGGKLCRDGKGLFTPCPR